MKIILVNFEEIRFVRLSKSREYYLHVTSLNQEKPIFDLLSTH